MAKKPVIVFLTVIAWLGALLILLAACLSSLASFVHINAAIEGEFWSDLQPARLDIFISYLGIFLALVSGFKQKPRYLSTCLIIVGAISILSYIEFFLVGTETISYNYYYVIKPHFPGMLLFLWLPGLLAIIEGIVINRLRKRKQLQAAA